MLCSISRDIWSLVDASMSLRVSLTVSEVIKS
jgi:hypothetical protein